MKYHKKKGGKVINKHIPNKGVQERSKKLAIRKKYEKEIQSYKNKIAYLNKIVG